MGCCWAWAVVGLGPKVDESMRGSDGERGTEREKVEREVKPVFEVRVKEVEGGGVMVVVVVAESEEVERRESGGEEVEERRS